MTNIDDVAQTLAEYERLAITSGEWEGIDAPDFSNDGDAWVQAWSPRETDDHPEFARTVVYRKGMRPIVVVVSWAESVPADETWRALWLAKPMKLFGAYVLRAALRRAFREVIGDRVEPDESAPRVDAPEPELHDWDHLIAIAATVEVLDGHWAQMRMVRARTAAREVAYLARREQLAAAAWEPVPARDLSADELAHHHAFFGHGPKAPQYHQPPQNRAARRASARKKGGRR